MTAEQERERIVAWLRKNGEKFIEKSKLAHERLVPRLHDEWCGNNLIAMASLVERGDHHTGETT